VPAHLIFSVSGARERLDPVTLKKRAEQRVLRQGKQAVGNVRNKGPTLKP
jgi:hypothetical protein